MPEWNARVAAVFAAHSVVPDADVVEELSQHAATAFEAGRADGLDDRSAVDRVDALIEKWCADPAVALRKAKRRPVVEAPAHGASVWSGIGQDLKYAARLLRRQIGFSLVTILTIALGIGATTTLFSVAYGVLMKPLPWPDADQLVRLSETRQGHEPRVKGTISNAAYNAWYEAHSTIEEIAGYRTVPSSALVGVGDATSVMTCAVTPSIFTVLKARPLLGRVFVDDDGRPGGSFPSRDVIILSYGLWQERFSGEDSAIGKTVQLAGKPFTVVGVMPREFEFPTRSTRAWTPWAIASVIASNGDRRMAIFGAIARLRSDVTPAQAAAEGTSRARSAPDPGLAAVAMFGGNGPAELSAVPAIEMMTAEVRPALLVLLAAVLLLFMTATANVASLQLARATTRRREMGIRAAIGAGAARLTRQLVVESGLLGVIGGAAGLAFALALHRALPSLLPADFPRVADVAVDWRVVLFAALCALTAGVVCGLLPAAYASRMNLRASLSDDGGAPLGGVLRSPTTRTRSAIMAAQLAIACVLLVGAALLTRSFVALLHADRGYDPRNLLTAQLPLPAAYSAERRVALLDAIAQRLRAVPGVAEAGFGNALPLLTSGGFRAFQMRPPNDPSALVDVNAMQRVVSPSYFTVLGLRVIGGRALAETDTMTSRNVIVVNRSFAAKYLGRRPLDSIVPNLGMCRGDNDQWAVVGIVEDMRQGGILSDAPQPELFMPYHQIGCPNLLSDPVIVIRTHDDPAPFASTLRQIVREQEPALALDSLMTMEERMMTNLAKPRLYAVVLTGFALFALTISGVGLFGVLSYIVAQRSREIGVRTALGARPSDIVGLVLRQVAVVAAAGIAAGLWAAFAASQSVATVLYGVAPHDPLSFVIVPVVLIVVTAMAAVVPARRAARVDPLTVLH